MSEEEGGGSRGVEASTAAVGATENEDAVADDESEDAEEEEEEEEDGEGPGIGFSFSKNFLPSFTETLQPLQFLSLSLPLSSNFFNIMKERWGEFRDAEILRTMVVGLFPERRKVIKKPRTLR